MNIKPLSRSLIITVCIHAQSSNCIYVTDSTYINFFSEEIVQDIDGTSYSAVGAFNKCTGAIYFRVPSASFKFPNKLMEEHYREQYMQTDKYPYITFKGTLSVKGDINKPGEYEATATGKFTIHGVTRERTVHGQIRVTPDNTIEGRAVFWVVPMDYGIKQPAMMGITAADSVRVTVYFRMRPYEQKQKEK